jgi:hypothetical protein
LTPDGGEADAEAGKVGEEVSRVGHDGQAVRQVAADDLACDRMNPVKVSPRLKPQQPQTKLTHVIQHNGMQQYVNSDWHYGSGVTSATFALMSWSGMSLVRLTLGIIKLVCWRGKLKP